MSFPPCPKRQKLVKIDSTGERIQVQQCAELSCSEFGETVTPDVCGSCLVRKSVLQKANKVMAKKPDVLLRKAVAEVAPDTEPKGNEWPRCKDRQLITTVKCCGTYEDIRRCDSKDCDHYAEAVTPKICASCPFRRG